MPSSFSKPKKNIELKGDSFTSYPALIVTFVSYPLEHTVSAKMSGPIDFFISTF